MEIWLKRYLIGVKVSATVFSFVSHFIGLWNDKRFNTDVLK